VSESRTYLFWKTGYVGSLQEPTTMLDKHATETNAETTTTAETASADETTDARDDAGTPAALSGHLADARRRTTLDVLADDDSTVELDDLARRVAAHEADLPPPEVDEERYERVVADLYERHLPALDDDDIVSLDREGGVFVSVDGRVARSLG
jgi:hypothetical protein